jgi:hypothetical protein
MRFFSAVFTMVVLSACATASAPTTPAAPWEAPPIPVAAVNGPFVAEWTKAANKSTCALVAPLGVTPTSAVARRANFSGGWAVAYDTPEKRSAFGIAGTGANAADPSYDEWPHRKAWRDGSTIGYGPEGGTGPNQLAYLRIQGQGCLYNVWSTLGIEHLEQLVESLRFVDVK